jgi:hypothetical protein
MLPIVQIWDAQNQELAGRVGVTSRRIASKVAEVLHDGKTAKIVPKAGATHMRCKKECPLWAKSGRELDAMHQRTRALLFYEKDTVKRCPSVARMF